MEAEDQTTTEAKGAEVGTKEATEVAEEAATEVVVEDLNTVEAVADGTKVVAVEATVVAEVAATAEEVDSTRRGTSRKKEDMVAVVATAVVVVVATAVVVITTEIMEGLVTTMDIQILMLEVAHPHLEVLLILQATQMAEEEEAISIKETNLLQIMVIQ